MKKKIIPLIIYFVALAIDFYLIPLLIMDTGTAMLFMLCVIPFIAFICSMIYGVRCGLNILLPVLAAIIFTPTLFIFYNSSAWVYIPAYAIITLIGNCVGRIFYKKR